MRIIHCATTVFKKIERGSIPLGSTKGVLNKPYFFKGGFAIVVWL